MVLKSMLCLVVRLPGRKSSCWLLHRPAEDLVSPLHNRQADHEHTRVAVTVGIFKTSIELYRCLVTPEHYLQDLQ